ncbi:MAG: molybdopterin molybdotransferase MoeA [Rhizobiales bacterium]|nr:molybdopterin molybdotransferase MoeA [Hyphomicrobiales bacterium]
MLMPVEEALARVLKAARQTDAVYLGLHEADGFTLAQPVSASRNQPPFDASAMDGYAVRHADLAPGAALRVIGEAAAGHAFAGSAGPMECVRIFTGAPLPQGTDTIVIQEDARRDGDQIIVTEIPAHGLYVRPAGMDFARGTALLAAGTVLDFRALSLAAAMNHAKLAVHRKPRVGIISNGDELVYPGETPRADQIIASNAYGVASIVRGCGGEPVDLGITADNTESLVKAFNEAAARQCDILVTLGGASVGDHDLIKPALARKGITLDFWKISMRPGKPLMFGALDRMLMLGMPGNPVSSLVCSLLFLKPLLLFMQGRDPAHPIERGILRAALPANGPRQAYLRGYGERVNGLWHVACDPEQDSSVLSVLARSNVLVIQPGNAPASMAGDVCSVFTF